MHNLKGQVCYLDSTYNLLITVLIGLLLICSSPVLFAQNDKGEPDFRIAHPQWNNTLDKAEKQIEEGDLDTDVTDELRKQISEVRNAARNFSLKTTEKTRELTKLLEALGPAPKEGEPVEAREVRQERERLEKSMGDVMGQASQSGLIVERTDLLLVHISQMEMKHLVSSLTTQGPLPLDPRVWVKAGSQFIIGYQSLVAGEGDEDAEQPILILIPVLVVFLLISLLAGFWTAKVLFGTYRRDSFIQNPGYVRKVTAAVVVGICRGIIPSLVLTLFASVLWNYWLQYQLDPEYTWPIGIYKAMILYLLTAGVIRAVFSPRVPEWNLTSVTPQAAKKISHYLHSLAAIIALTVAFEAVLVDTGKAAEFGSVYALIKNSVISVSLLFLARKGLWKAPFVQQEGSEESWIAQLWFWPHLRFLTVLCAAVALICSVLGFHNLADFILPRIILTGFLAILIVTIRIMMRDFFTVLLKRESGINHSLRNTLSLDKDNSNRLNFWVMTFIDSISVLCAAYLLLVLWEPPELKLHNELMDWLGSWFGGVSFGSYTFSLADVLLAIIMLFVVIGLTRVIRTLLEHKLLPQTRMGIGARTAVSSSVGYLGFLIAVLVAVSTLGIDLGKLALIAGALSVGIGFGLQNIVNNFVSGLILLYEQPVKIGDWVVVGALEGKVKQINVRATEIETFDRASVIIPNADLLQTSVTNWTHDSSFGRIGIGVGVGYDSDPEQVEMILLDCARSHTLVLTLPEPYVRFIEFGESSLDFRLYIFVDDIENRLTIGSDIRKSILIEFRAAGIEIPFPQRVVSVNKPDVELGED